MFLAGSWNASVGYNEASSSSEATQHVNTRLNVGHLSSTSDNLTLRGAVVMADTADITTGKLTIESLQDTHTSENSSKGINVGIGAGTDSIGKPQSGSGGVNFAKGNAEGAITGEQTALLIADGANSQVTAEHTFVKGGMIANASWEVPEGADENAAPVLVDHGQLNFTTGTLTVEDLRDYSRSSQTGGGIQTNFGLSRYSGDNPEHYETYTTESGEQGTRGKQYPTGATTISLQSEGRRMEGATLATIGGGNVVVGGVALDEHEDFADLNRDIDKGQIVTVDQQTGALNGSFSVDHRLLSGTGRQVIADQHVDLGDNFKMTVGGIAGDLSRTGTVLGGVILEAGQIGAGLAHINGNQGVAYAEEGRLAGDIEGIRDGDVADAVYAQQALNSIDGYFLGAEGEAGQRVKVTEGAISDNGYSVAGAANESSGTMYIDIAGPHRDSLMRTFTEESMHLGGAGDPMAGLVGWFGDLTYRVNAWANSDNIREHHAVVPVQDWTVHNRLLQGNHGGFVRDAANDQLLYRQIETAEIRAIRDFVPTMTEQLGGTDAENERRLAQTLVGLLDRSWAEHQQANGQELDAQALAMLGEALLPLAESYAPMPYRESEVPWPQEEINALTATTAEQLQQHLLDYNENHARLYDDRTGGNDDFSNKYFSLQTSFYNQNFGGNDPLFNYEGVAGAGVGLFDTGVGVLDGIAYAIGHPDDAFKAVFLGTRQLVFDTPGFINDINNAHNDSQLNSYLDYLQGDYYGSGYTSTMGDLSYGMEWAGLIPANRMTQLGRLDGVMPDGGVVPDSADILIIEGVYTPVKFRNARIYALEGPDGKRRWHLKSGVGLYLYPNLQRGVLDIYAPEGWAKHHLIPVSEAQKSTALQRLAEAGIYNVNRASNGIALPTNEIESIVLKRPLHNGGHLGGYFDDVGGRLRQLDAIQDRLTNSQLLEEVSLIEEIIRSDILNRNLRLQKNGY